MGQIVSGTFIADNAIAANIDIGFIPDYVELISALGSTELIVRFYRCLADAETTGQYGIIDDGAGVISMCANAAAGIAPYDEGEINRVLIEHPSTGRDSAVAVAGDWTTTLGTNATARTLTAIGTIIRPTTHNGYVYECTTAMTTGASTEPTWGTTPGELTVGGSTGAGRWICREENLTKRGGMGFTVGASISGDGEIWVFKAERHDRMGDMGDAADLDPVSFPKYSN